MRAVASGLVRGAYFAGGMVALGLGLVGIVTPLLPTTPFLLVAAFCLARSSPAYHAWLRSHPRLGGALRDWEQGGVIRPSAKRLATLLILISGGVSLAQTRIPVWGRVGLTLVLLGVLGFIWSRPDAASRGKEPSPL